MDPRLSGEEIDQLLSKLKRGEYLEDYYRRLLFREAKEVELAYAAKQSKSEILLEMKNRGELKNADGSNGVRLCYIDPPFATKQDFRGSRGQRAYRDKIAGAEFIEFLRKR
jgi:hypothetical protein